MPEFKKFREELTKHVNKIMKGNEVLFVVNVDKDILWNKYLDSFPEGANELFRERREYDCAACRSFIKHFGHVVAIVNNKIVSIWDFETSVEIFKPVVKALSKMIHECNVNEIFLSKESRIGIPSNMEKTSVDIITWNHFYIDLMSKFVYTESASLGDVKGRFNEKRGVFTRGLRELTDEAFEIVLDLIDQNTLYKGAEWKSQITAFIKLKKEYNKLSEEQQRDLFCWLKVSKIDDVIAKIRNTSIGTLLIDLSENMDVDSAVRRYESVVAPSNYKRPKAIFTKKMVEDAQKKLSELGLVDSLGRRYANINDISVNNVLFADKDVVKQMKDGVFDELIQSTTSKPRKFAKAEEISIENFIDNVLPRVEHMEILFEARHQQNLMSLIAPINADAPTLFKWNNPFCWAYNGNITDSMIRDNVKNAGGKVDGVLRFSIQWNDSNNGVYNGNDFDAHCVEPNGNRIYYGASINKHTLGNLDVDIRIPKRDKPAVENITWPNLQKMDNGVYKFMVHNYLHNGGWEGFKAEIAFNGETYSFCYDRELEENEWVQVADVTLKNGEFSIKPSLDCSESSSVIWEIKTNQFYPVSSMMYSPNYWDDQQGIGHKHYMFMITGCVNTTSPNGFFNEFLKNELMEQKRVFEALGGKMRVQDSEGQLSGLGFTSTRRNHVILKLTGSIDRIVKVLF